MIRWRVWRDDELRRYIPTGDGSMVIEPGETCVLVVGKNLDAKLLAALTGELQPTETPTAAAPGFKINIIGAK